MSKTAQFADGFDAKNKSKFSGMDVLFVFFVFCFFVGNLISMGFVDLFRGGVDSRIIAFFVGWEMVGKMGGG